MSCFESSLFKRNQIIANAHFMAKACQKLGLSSEDLGPIVRIYDDKPQLLMIIDYGRVFYNNNQDEDLIKALEAESTIMMQEMLDEMQRREENNRREIQQREEQKRIRQLRLLNVEYARMSIVQIFEEKGFYHQPDNNFRPTVKEIDRFYMCAYTSMDEDPEDRITNIQFTILSNGSIVSDSNYIPEDVHEKADEAMESLEKAMGCQRREGIEIKRKRIPEKYIDKSYCSIHSKGLQEAFQ